MLNNNVNVNYNRKYICLIIYIMINRQSREIYEDEYLLETER